MRRLGAASLGDLSAFSAPQDAVVWANVFALCGSISLLTYHRTFAIFRSVESSFLSLNDDLFLQTRIDRLTEDVQETLTPELVAGHFPAIEPVALDLDWKTRFDSL